MEENFLQELSEANIVSQGFSIELITEIGEFFQDIASYNSAGIWIIHSKSIISHRECFQKS